MPHPTLRPGLTVYSGRVTSSALAGSKPHCMHDVCMDVFMKMIVVRPGSRVRHNIRQSMLRAWAKLIYYVVHLVLEFDVN